MCLSLPAKIIAIQNGIADADCDGTRLSVNLAYTPDIAIGDWVLVHAGFSLQKYDAEEAAETIRLLRELSHETPRPL
jgi:hydrogenase expression/formation protein HypC